MKLQIEPKFRGEDRGDGGIRRVVEAQVKHLPKFGIELTNFNPDIVAVHAGVWVETHVPVVSHCHGLYWEDYGWAKWAVDLNKDVISAIKRADVVTAPSKWIADILKHGMWIDAIPLHHGVDIEEWEPSDNPRDYVLWNKTRIDAICDPEPLHVLARLAPNNHFVTTLGGQSDNVVVTGVLPHADAKSVIRHAGVYLATTRETFGIGTLEAMASGVPVLGWEWGGQREIITHMENGWLCKPGDFEGLLEGLHYCLEHRERLGSNARQTVIDRFTWSRVMEDYARVYEQTIKGAGYGTKVSVVVPCYNLAHYLPDCINSILNQDFRDYEIIIVNDASTDNTGQVARGLAEKDSRIKVVTNTENQYLAGALNTGIAASRGKYIIPLDADNMLGDYCLKTLSDALDADRDIDIAYGAMEVLEENGGRWISDWPFDEFNYRAQLDHKNQISSTSMYRRTVWERSGGYRSRCQTAEDAEYWCRAVSLGFKPKKVSTGPLFVYRNRKDSMSHVNSDWAWHTWFPKHRTPFGVDHTAVPTYEPVLVSVIIPVGPGHSKRVIDAVDSIWAQSFDNWECIVVDDNNDSYWLPPFVTRFRTNNPGSGPAIARNIGLANAKGRTVLFLDADDYLQPRAIELMYNAYEPGKYVYCDWFIQENGEVHETHNYDCYAMLREMSHSVTMLVPTNAARFDTQLDAWEDWDYCLQLAEQGLCGVRVPVPLLNYRTKGGTRREQLYARMDELKVNIYTKWQKYMDGEEKLMACGCSRTSVAPPPSQMQQLVPNGDLVLLQYNSNQAGTRTFRGQNTGVMYRFGNDEDHRVKLVHKSDAMHLLQHKEFSVKEDLIVEQQLVAAR